MPLSAAKLERTLANLQHGRSQFGPERPGQLEDLRLRVREAAAWCAAHLDPSAVGASLRPSRLAPATLASSRWNAVDDVVAARRIEVRNTLDDRYLSGRLLLYFPDADLADGAAELASGGFFDVHNAPPWGSWVGYFDDRGADRSFSCYLLAWVPQLLVAPAEAGIDVNPELCIGWFADAQVTLRSVLQPSELWDAG
jgi:hypothetical protein